MTEQPIKSKCCAARDGHACGEDCKVVDGIELPFCEEHAEDKALWRAWIELS